MVETSEKEVQKVPFLCFIVLEIQIDYSGLLVGQKPRTHAFIHDLCVCGGRVTTVDLLQRKWLQETGHAMSRNGEGV